MSSQVTEPGPIAGLLPGFVPENELERRVTRDPELLAGLAWGKPRPGHPEGTVAAHVGHLLETLDEWDEPPERRAALRFVALVHDAFKGDVIERLPKMGRNHHADRARRFAELYTRDETILSTIQHHDRPYSLWRSARRRRSFARAGDAVANGAPVGQRRTSANVARL
jgi:hypothetical protein